MSKTDTRPMDRLKYAPQRQARILERVRTDMSVDVIEIAKELRVSAPTIRRDMKQLESKGLIRRTHGGAVDVSQVRFDLEPRKRETVNFEAKGRIGRKAAEHVIDGDTVFVDAGVTALPLAQELVKRSELMLITNGLDVAQVLADSQDNPLYVIGGEFRGLNRSFSGPLAIEMVSKFSIDKAFLCVASIDVERGLISTVNPNFATFQREVIAISNRVTVIADTSKFRRSALAIISPLSEIDAVITSDGLQPEWRNGLDAHNVEVIEARWKPTATL